MWVILGHLVILWQVVFKLKMVKMKQCEITIQSNRCGKWPTWSKFITMSDWLCHKKYIIHNIKYQGFTFLSGCARAISHFWLVAHVPLNNFPRIILIKCGSHLKYRSGGWYGISNSMYISNQPFSNCPYNYLNQFSLPSLLPYLLKKCARELSLFLTF